MLENFSYGKDHLTAKKALQLVQEEIKGVFEQETIDGIHASHQNNLTIAQGDETVYGINTGFGPLCTTKISPADLTKLQENILRSHSVGVGEPVPVEVSKLMMILKLHALSRGFSGVSLKVLERIQWMIDKNVIPIVPRQGSVGASGDLAPLAHLFLPLIGLGRVWLDGNDVPTEKVFKEHELQPLQLGPKEGLALINGTQFMLAYGMMALDRFYNCLEVADIVGAMSLEGMLGSVAPFREELHQIRPFKGSQFVAERLTNFLQNSEMVESHINCDRVQDPYSIRCMPQVHGASRNAWLHLKEVIEIEANSVTDNPIILDESTAVSGGNFHGQLLALPLDYAAIAAAELGNISDRRIYLLLDGEEAGLPKLLMKHTGINSGFMIPQYTSAALVSENKSLVWPASADSIPTSLGQEDHVSMGSIGSRKLNQILSNLENILAVELVCAAQAFDYHAPTKSGPLLQACHMLIREHIDHAEEDRIFAEDIKKAAHLIRSKILVNTLKEAAQNLELPINEQHNDLFEVY